MKSNVVVFTLLALAVAVVAVVALGLYKMMLPNDPTVNALLKPFVGEWTYAGGEKLYPYTESMGSTEALGFQVKPNEVFSLVYVEGQTGWVFSKNGATLSGVGSGATKADVRNYFQQWLSKYSLTDIYDHEDKDANAIHIGGWQNQIHVDVAIFDPIGLITDKAHEHDKFVEFTVLVVDRSK
jgi:hypothetical protein